MKMDPRCTYCLLSRVHYEAKLSTDDDDLIYRTMQAGLDVLKETYKPGVAAGVVSTAIHRKAYEMLGDDDPYVELRKLSNRIAEKVYPYAHSLVYEGSPSDEEMFRRAVLASVIGNFFDFGIMGFDVGEDVFDRTFAEIFRKDLDVDDTSEMFGMLDDVVYVVDNCGEIILDTLVFDIIRKVGGKITLVVRGAPMLTDVTMENVHELELDKKVDRVLTTGSNAVGVCFDEAPAEFIEALENASLIISKGMANYETMSEENFGSIAYLLRTKCEAVAEDMGLEMGCSVAKLVR
ncbi:damage-control phosphatase ARMT1 family protein [Methanococcoides sp. LMO-2]|uniref:ARMT1-like domain-containing protein n=1 Tax=Methanococcoides cohabitans TaxID=3136559 RepID=A0ABU9KSE8_9EURY